MKFVKAAISYVPFVSAVFLLLCLIARPLSAAEQDVAEQDGAVRALISDLSSTDDEVRREAARRLRDLAPHDRASVLALAKATRDRDQQVSGLAIDALARIGPNAAPAINYLIDRLGDRDPQKRYRAAYALGMIGEAAVDPLRNLLQDGSPSRSVAAMQAFHWMGEATEPAIPDLVARLSDENQEIASAACEALWHIGPRSVEPLKQTAANAVKGQARRLAITALGLIEPPQLAAIPLIENAMNSEDPEIREAAVTSFALLARRSDAIDCRPLFDRLEDSVSTVRRAAAMGVVRVRRNSNDAVPKLRQMLKQSAQDAEVAAFAFEVIRPDDRPTIIALLDAIDSQPDARPQILMTLQAIGDAMLPHLVAAIRDGRLDASLGQEIVQGSQCGTGLRQIITQSSPEDQIVAAKLLGAVRPVEQASVHLLVQQLDSPSDSLRLAAILALGQMEKAAASAEAAIRKRAETDSSEAVRAAALTALFRIGVDPNTLEQAILVGLQNENVDIRRECARAMSQFDQLDAEQSAVLLKAISDRDKLVRLNAIASLQKVAKVTDDVLESLIGLLNDPDNDIRLAALETIAHYGEKAKAVAQELSGRLDDESLRLPVLRTIAALGPAAESAAHKILEDELLHSKSEDVRIAAASALSSIMSDRANLIDQLMRQLSDPSWAVRKNSATLLGEEGERAAVAVPKLLELLRSSEDSDFARNALRAIDASPPEAVPILVEILRRDSDRRARYYAMHLLRKSGPAAKNALPDLQAILAANKFDSRTQRFLEQTIEDIEDLTDE